MKKIVKRYWLFILFLIINFILLVIYPSIGQQSFRFTQNNLVEMVKVIPPIFILLGLFDVWVPKETMIKFMGEKSGIKGLIIAFLLGSFAAGPLYAAFPIAGVLIKKGSRLLNVFIFIGAWSTTKVPLLLFEAASLGWKFTLLRLIINLFGIIIIALITEKVLTSNDRSLVYASVN